uniref:Tyr recombinase domain-containing protein n=1 Tax=Caulerpa verticillata TaxID=177082 RepID=A0A386B080_9CHLO|nr:hypothetical protein [Caulerpa verticillata]AYC65108.1 hypothetical protein [Caulerpa verticillata]
MKYLYELNSQIYLKQEDLQQANLDLQAQLTELIEYKRQVQQEKQIKEARRLQRRRRRARPVPENITFERYLQLMLFIPHKSFASCRARLAFTIMAITGIRYKEMQLLPVGKVISLFENGKCYINPVKRGRGNHLALLSPQGVQFLQERQDDFNLVLAPKIVQRSNDHQSIFLNLFSFLPKENHLNLLTMTIFCKI